MERNIKLDSILNLVNINLSENELKEFKIL